MQNDAPRRRFLSVAVFLVTFGIYLACASMEVGWGDSAKYVLLAADPEVSVRAGHHIGYSYTTALLVRLVPLGSYASRVHQINALYAALALMLMFKVLRRIVVKDAAALLSVFALALSYPIFSQATIAESYPFFWLVMSLFIVSAAKWRETRKASWLLLGAFIAGFGVCVNLSTILLLPAVIVFFVTTLAKDRPDIWKPLLAAVGFFILGMLPLIVCAAIVLARGEYDLSGTVSEMTDVKYAGPFFLTSPGIAIKGIAAFFGLAAYAFPFLAGILAVIGFADQFRRDRTVAITLLVAVVLPVVFFSTYMRQRLAFIYSIPMFLTVFWVAHGAKRMLDRFPSRRAFVISFAAVVVAPVAVYAVVHLCSRQINGKLKSALNIRAIPHRDNAKYFLVPWRFHGTGTREFAEEVFVFVGGPSARDKIPQSNSVIHKSLLYSDFTPYAPLEYYQRHENLGFNVRIEMKEKRVDAGRASMMLGRNYKTIWFLTRHIAPEDMDYYKVVPAPDPERGPYWQMVTSY